MIGCMAPAVRGPSASSSGRRPGSCVRSLVVLALVVVAVPGRASPGEAPTAEPLSLAVRRGMESAHVTGARGARGTGYDPVHCEHDQDGHCNDTSGGAWRYRRKDGRCRHDELNVPRAADLVRALPRLFPGVRSVLDFGGGPGAYLTSFRDAGVRDIVTVEPHPLRECLFAGIQQLTVNIFEQPVNRTYDLVMSVEVAEHVPSDLHPQLIAWLISHTNRWIIFTAAHPGQGGEGHVANKEPLTWRNEFVSSAKVSFDSNLTRAVKRTTKASIIQQNLHVFEKL